jgi:hypothetical protein
MSGLSKTVPSSKLMTQIFMEAPFRPNQLNNKAARTPFQGHRRLFDNNYKEVESEETTADPDEVRAELVEARLEAVTGA